MVEEDTTSLNDSGSFGSFAFIEEDDIGSEIELLLELVASSGPLPGGVGPSLQPMAGTLKQAIPLARRGHVIHALEEHPENVRWARKNLSQEPPEVRRRVSIHQQDIRDFQLNHRYGFVFFAENSFLKLLNGFDQVLCLRTIKDHLVPGAHVLIDVFRPVMDDDYLGERLDHNATIDVDSVTGSKVVKYFSHRYDLEAKRVYLTYYYDVFSEGEYRRIEVPFELRYMEHYDFLELFKRAGYEVVAVYGDYDKRPLEEDSKRMIYLLKAGPDIPEEDRGGRSMLREKGAGRFKGREADRR